MIDPQDLATRAIDELGRLIAFDTTSRDSNLDLIGHVEALLGDLGVAGSQQRVAREDRVGLRDLATQELDREASHGSDTVPRRRTEQTDGAARSSRAAPSVLSCDSRSRPADLRTPQQATLTVVSSRRRSKRGERALGDFRREAWASAQ